MSIFPDTAIELLNTMRKINRHEIIIDSSRLSLSINLKKTFELRLNIQASVFEVGQFDQYSKSLDWN